MTARPSPHLIELTAQQAEVLTRVAWGWDQPKIARDLGLTVHTVRSQFREVLQRLGANDRAHAVALAIGLGLLPADVATNPQPGGHRVR